MTTGKTSTLLILILLATLNGYSQPLNVDQYMVDSLEQVLPNAANDTNKVNSLMDLSQMFLETSADRSLAYAQMADTLSQELKYDRAAFGVWLISLFTMPPGPIGPSPLQFSMRCGPLPKKDTRSFYLSSAVSCI
jgi:hypothetical protein